MQPTLWLQALTGLRDNKNAPSNLLSQVLQVIGKICILIHSLIIRLVCYMEYTEIFIEYFSSREIAITITSANVFIS